MKHVGEFFGDAAIVLLLLAIGLGAMLASGPDRATTI